MSYRQRFLSGIVNSAFRIPCIILTIAITTLYIVTFTGCISKTALTPTLFLFTIRKANTWLRVGYFGACFGDTSSTTPIACAPTKFAGSADHVVAKMNIGGNSAATLLIKHAQQIQSTGIIPLLPLTAAILFLVSSIAFVVWKDSKPLWHPRNLANLLTFKLAFASLVLLLGSLLQVYAAVVGMADASEILESPDFKVEKNVIIIMVLQGIALGLQGGFTFLMYKRCMKVEMMHMDQTR